MTRSRLGLLAAAVVVAAAVLLAARTDGPSRRDVVGTGRGVAAKIDPIATSAAGRGVPASFDPTAISATGARSWWVLGQASSCPGPSCTPTLLHTGDAGHSFTVLRRPPVTAASALYAADSRDLFVVGDGGHRLLLSSDAGRSWRTATPLWRGQAVLMGTPQGAHGYVYAVVWSRGGTTELVRARLRTLAHGSQPAAVWKRLPAPRGQIIGLMAQGRDLLALIQPSSPSWSRLYASHDAGMRFRPTGARFGALECRFDPAGRVIWADCATGMLFGIWRSSDGGRSFGAGGSDAYRRTTGRRPVFAGTSGANFAPLSASTALLGLHPLYRTTDGGASYRPIAGSPRGVVQWIQFELAGPGLMLAVGRFTVGGTPADPTFRNRLYVVTEAGTRFRRIGIA